MLFSAGPATTTTTANNNNKKVAVLDLISVNVKPLIARSANEILHSLIRGYEPGAEVVAAGETDCPGTACLVQVGKGLNAQEVISGRLAGMGGNYVFELQRVDVALARVINTSVRTVERNEDDLFTVEKQSVAALYGQGATASDSSKCDGLYQIGKWMLCRSHDQVYIWFGPDADPAFRFSGLSSGYFYVRHGDKESYVGTGGAWTASREPWGHGMGQAVPKTGSITPNWPKDNFRLGGTEFELADNRIKVALPNGTGIEVSGDGPRTRYRDASNRSLWWFEK